LTIIHCWCLCIIHLAQAQLNVLVPGGPPAINLTLTHQSELWSINAKDTPAFTLNATTTNDCLKLTLLHEDKTPVNLQWPDYEAVHQVIDTVGYTLLIKNSTMAGTFYLNLTLTASPCVVVSIGAYIANMYESNEEFAEHIMMKPRSVNYFHLVIQPDFVNFVEVNSSDCFFPDPFTYVTYGKNFASPYNYDLIPNVMNENVTGSTVKYTVLPSTSSGEYNLVFANLQEKDCQYTFTQFPVEQKQLNWGATLMNHTILPRKYRFYELVPNPNSISDNTYTYQVLTKILPPNNGSNGLTILGLNGNVPTLHNATDQNRDGTPWLNLSISFDAHYFVSVYNTMDKAVSYNIHLQNFYFAPKLPDWLPFLVILGVLVIVGLILYLVQRILQKKQMISETSYTSIPVNEPQEDITVDTKIQ